MEEINKEIGVKNGMKILDFLSGFYPSLTWKEEFGIITFYLNDLNLNSYPHNYKESTLNEFVNWNNEIFIRQITINENNELETLELN